MKPRRRSIAPPTSSPCTMSPAASECSTRSCTSRSIRREPVSPSTAISASGRSAGSEDARPHRVVDVVVDVGDPVDQPDDLALQRRRLARPARVPQDPVAHRRGQVQALQHVDHPQRVLVVPEPAAEALARAAVQHVLADVAERRVAEVVPEPDRLREVLVQPQRPRDRARDLRRLQRVGEPRAVVVALGRHEHLRLVLEPPERLAVHDPVAVALERRAQTPQSSSGARAIRGIGAGGERREPLGLPRLLARGEGVGRGRSRSDSAKRGGHSAPRGAELLRRLFAYSRPARPPRARSARGRASRTRSRARPCGRTRSTPGRRRARRRCRA